MKVPNHAIRRAAELRLRRRYGLTKRDAERRVRSMPRPAGVLSWWERLLLRVKWSLRHE